MTIDLSNWPVLAAIGAGLLFMFWPKVQSAIGGSGFAIPVRLVESKPKDEPKPEA